MDFINCTKNTHVTWSRLILTGKAHSVHINYVFNFLAYNYAVMNCGPNFKVTCRVFIIILKRRCLLISISNLEQVSGV